MSNYAPNTPRDRDSMPKSGYPPAKIALASTNKENASASSILLLNDATAEIQVTAAGQNTAGKWLSISTIDSSVAGTSVITAAGATTNFDFMIPNNTEKRLVVPVLTQVTTFGNLNTGSMYGLARGVAFKTFVGTGSVLTAEF